MPQDTEINVNHKGGWCPYKDIWCQEGYCQDCEIYKNKDSNKAE
jgi:hypothetical protein